MPEFSRRSLEALGTAHPALQALFTEVVKHRDCVVLEGHRGRADQEKAVASGASRLHWPRGQHNATPSLAVDVAPYPLDWNDRDRFLVFAGFVLGVATVQGLTVRWGGDWDGDGDLKDQKLVDLPHFELREVTVNGKRVAVTPTIVEEEP